MHVATNIRRIRKAKRLTQGDVARLAGLSSIAMVEKRGWARQSTLEAIAKALDVTLADLLQAPSDSSLPPASPAPRRPHRVTRSRS